MEETNGKVGKLEITYGPNGAKFNVREIPPVLRYIPSLMALFVNPDDHDVAFSVFLDSSSYIHAVNSKGQLTWELFQFSIQDRIQGFDSLRKASISLAIRAISLDLHTQPENMNVDQKNGRSMAGRAWFLEEVLTKGKPAMFLVRPGMTPISFVGAGQVYRERPRIEDGRKMRSMAGVGSAGTLQIRSREPAMITEAKNGFWQFRQPSGRK